MGGALRGGEINFVASAPRWYLTDKTQRFHLFRVDDNDDPGEFTGLAVVTRQRSRDLRGILREGGLLSVAVSYIADPPSNATVDGPMRLVVGELTQRVRGGDLKNSADYDLGNRIGHIGEPLNGFVTPTFDRDGQTVYTHVLCLEADGTAVSRAEKMRRIAAFEATVPAPDGDGQSAPLRDGRLRMVTLQALH